jgi:hypothetical protein
MDGQRMEVEHYVSEHLIGLNLDQQLKALIGEIKEKILQGAIGKTAKMRVSTKRNNIKERVQ